MLNVLHKKLSGIVPFLVCHGKRRYANVGSNVVVNELLDDSCVIRSYPRDIREDKFPGGEESRRVEQAGQ